MAPNSQTYNWMTAPLGVPFPVKLSRLPPNNDPDFRFLKLTADDPYNGGLFNNKAVSGTSPNVVVKMRVNSAKSPLNGMDYAMLNDMEAPPIPSLTEGKIIQDAIRNITASTQIGHNHRESYTNTVGAFHTDTVSQISTNSTTNQQGDSVLKFDASRVVPTAARNQIFAEGWCYIVRIY